MICQFIQAHSTAILFVVGYISTAAVNNLPPEDEPFKFSPWFRGTLRTIFNAPVFKKFKDLEKNSPEVKQ